MYNLNNSQLLKKSRNYGVTILVSGILLKLKNCIKIQKKTKNTEIAELLRKYCKHYPFKPLSELAEFKKLGKWDDVQKSIIKYAFNDYRMKGSYIWNYYMIDLFAEYAHIERWCKYKTLKIVQEVFNLENPKLENYIEEAEEAGGEVPPYREIAMIINMIAHDKAGNIYNFC